MPKRLGRRIEGRAGRHDRPNNPGMTQPPGLRPTTPPRKSSRPRPLPQPAVTDPTVVAAARDLFWENVVREMLTGLSMMQGAHSEMFDGRIAVLTKAGERIPIGEVAPMFACSILQADAWQRAAAVAVECTVFRIKTPGGELYTLPLREIRGMHAMTPELLKHIEQQAIQRLSEEPHNPPFGLAAFTTVHREQMTEVETPPEEGEPEAHPPATDAPAAAPEPARPAPARENPGP